MVLRALALSLGPDIIERVQDTSVSYERRSIPFITVHMARGRLHVIFPPTVILADPNGRLLKRGEERYVSLEGPESLDGHVQEFVRNAYASVRR